MSAPPRSAWSIRTSPTPADVTSATTIRRRTTWRYPDAIGVKTGATALGTCLVTAAKREDVTIICVQMGMLGSDNAARREELFKRAIQFFEYVFTYEYTKIDASALIGRYIEQVDVQNLPGTQV